MTHIPPSIKCYWIIYNSIFAQMRARADRRVRTTHTHRRAVQTLKHQYVEHMEHPPRELYTTVILQWRWKMRRRRKTVGGSGGFSWRRAKQNWFKCVHVITFSCSMCTCWLWRYWRRTFCTKHARKFDCCLTCDWSCVAFGLGECTCGAQCIFDICIIEIDVSSECGIQSCEFEHVNW